jgi:hypothetical protein
MRRALGVVMLGLSFLYLWSVASVFPWWVVLIGAGLFAFLTVSFRRRRVAPTVTRSYGEDGL